MSELVPPLWKRITKDFEPIDGEFYIFAARITNNNTNKEYWQIEKLQFVSYDDGCDLCYASGESFSDWEYSDAEFYIKCEDN